MLSLCYDHSDEHHGGRSRTNVIPDITYCHISYHMVKVNNYYCDIHVNARDEYDERHPNGHDKTFRIGGCLQSSSEIMKYQVIIKYLIVKGGVRGCDDTSSYFR